MSPSNDAEQPYRFLADQSSETDLIFWVKNEADANSPAFINTMLMETMRGPDRTRIPMLFSLAISKPDSRTSFAVYPVQQGGWLLDIKCERANS